MLALWGFEAFVGLEAWEALLCSARDSVISTAITIRIVMAVQGEEAYMQAHTVFGVTFLGSLYIVRHDHVANADGVKATE